MAAMAKWAKAEEGMRLVQELESHLRADDAIANLQNMLNGIGKTTDVAEAAALAAAPPAPHVPPTGVPAAPRGEQHRPRHDADAGRRRGRRSRRAAAAPPPRRAAAARDTPRAARICRAAPSEGDAGAFAARSRAASSPRRSRPDPGQEVRDAQIRRRRRAGTVRSRRARGGRLLSDECDGR